MITKFLGLLVLDLERLLDGWPSLETLIPSMEMRKVVRSVQFLVFHEERHEIVPRNKGEIDVGAFVAHKIFSAFEMAVEHTELAFDFVCIAVDCGGEILLFVKVCEPSLSALGSLYCLSTKRTKLSARSKVLGPSSAGSTKALRDTCSASQCM